MIRGSGAAREYPGIEDCWHSTVEAAVLLKCFGVSFSCMLLLEEETDNFVKDPLTEIQTSSSYWLCLVGGF